MATAVERDRTDDAAALLGRLRGLRGLIEAHAAADENATQIAAPVIEALEEAGLFALMAPAVLGGVEAHPLAVLETLKLLSYYDGSTGWYAQAATTGPAIMGAFLGDRAIEAIFMSGALATCAGQAAPTGKAERVGDGYRITGSFSFASGIANARWVLGGYLLHKDGALQRRENGDPILLIAFVPRDRVELRGNWQVLGLRGTGSYDYHVPEQVVHADFVFDPAATPPKRGGPLYRMGFLAIPALCHASFGAGCGRRILDEWGAHATAKKRPQSGTLSEGENFRRSFAAAYGELTAAEAYVRTTYDALFDAAARGPVPAGLTRDSRLCASTMLATGTRLAQAAFTAGATTALREGSTLQRGFRDMQAGNAHFLTNEQSFIDLGGELVAAAPFEA